MKILLTLISCLALAPLSGIAQQNQNQKKKPVVQQGKGQKGTTFAKPIQPQHNFQKTPLHTNTGVQGTKTTTYNKTNTFNKTTNKTVNKTYKIQHFNLPTNKVVTKYKTVNFNANFKIAGAYRWKGPRYAVFVNYHPVWQNQWWWRSHYNHVVFIYGGWYYWNAGYWYPAWGYDPASVYYFDGPIYASNPEVDPGQVVANVQSALQQEGYYNGEVDGVLGPQTRGALADYQQANGLEPTGAVDEPTLESLGMS